MVDGLVVTVVELGGGNVEDVGGCVVAVGLYGIGNGRTVSGMGSDFFFVWGLCSHKFFQN